jgi:hypothetical protein
METCLPKFQDRRDAHVAWVVTCSSAPMSVVVFQHLFPMARREGAIKLGVSEDVVVCERKKDYDSFAEYGRVPPRRMLEDGYWFDCPHCEMRIRLDNPETPISNIVVEPSGEVFCNENCSAAHEPIRQQRNKRFESFKLRLKQRYPRLKFFEFQGGYPHRFDLARFEFPGGMFPGSVEEVEEGYQWCISQIDVIAWQQFTGK